MTARLAGWIFGALVLVIGVLNLLLVHPAFKVVLGIVVVMFTLGVSDLGDMID